MPCSLWRNAELMADLVVPFPTPQSDTVCGMLRVAERFTDISELVQSRMRIFPGAVFIHHFTDENQAPAKTVTLCPMSVEQPRGVPSAEQFELRNDQGEPMALDSIWIRRIEVPEGAGAFPDACHAVGLSGSCWMIIAGREREHPPGEV